MTTVSKLTEKYIREHPSIRDCLSKGLINYSALSRFISQQLNINKKTSMEAILVASRRYKDKLDNKILENQIIDLFKNSSFNIKNKITVFIIEKNIYSKDIIEIENKIKKNRGIFFSIEGTKTITLITEDRDNALIDEKLKNYIISKNSGLSLISIYSPGIETTPGAIAYLTSQFFENNINIIEIMSSWNDTIIIVKSEDINDTLGFINF